jgi:hypothetical protein
MFYNALDTKFNNPFTCLTRSTPYQLSKRYLIQLTDGQRIRTFFLDAKVLSSFNVLNIITQLFYPLTIFHYET